MRNTFVIVDSDHFRKAAVARAVADLGYSIPVDTIDDLGPVFPESAWLLVSSHDCLAEDTLARIKELGRFYPLIVYGDAMPAERTNLLLHRGLVGMFPLPLTAEAVKSCLDRLGPIAERVARSFAESLQACLRIETLSPREEEVMALMSHGRSNKEISGILGISPRTVEIHRAKALCKLKVSNSFEAARLFYQAGSEPSVRPSFSAAPATLRLAA